MQGDSAPRLLLLDIETFPNVSYTWGVYEQNVLSVKEHAIICCYSAKWLHGEQITKALPDYRGYTPALRDDAKIVHDLWKLLNDADIAIAQNGDNFDFKKINTRIAKHGLPPPSPYKTVDTLKVARKVFGFDSNKLDDLCEYLGVGRKFNTGGFELWKGCMAGDQRAWRKMRRYNAQDVRLLEALYVRFLPWISNHPNLRLYSDDNGCPKCGGRLNKEGVKVMASGVYQRYKCVGCGGWSRSSRAVRQTNIRNVA